MRHHHLALVALLAAGTLDPSAAAQGSCSITPLFGPGSPEFGTPPFALNQLELELLDGSGSPLTCLRVGDSLTARIEPYDGLPNPYPQGITCFGAHRFLLVSTSLAPASFHFDGELGQLLGGGVVVAMAMGLPFVCDLDLPAPMTVSIPNSPSLVGTTIWIQGAEVRDFFQAAVPPQFDKIFFTQVLEATIGA